MNLPHIFIAEIHNLYNETKEENQQKQLDMLKQAEPEPSYMSLLEANAAIFDVCSPTLNCD